MLIRSAPRLSSHGVQQYWTASKCRLDRWARNLKSFAADATQVDATAVRVQWPYVRGVLEEILTGEVLTRVWTAVLCLYDRQHGGNEFESLARSIMIGHLEARHRVLMLLVRGPGVDAEGAVKLNHLRRRAERWTDLLVGHLARYGDVAELAINVDRAVEFSRDLEFQTDQARWAAGLAAATGFPAGGLSARTGAGQSQRRPQRPDRLGHSLLLSRRSVRFDRPFPLALAAPHVERHQRRAGHDRFAGRLRDGGS